MIAAALALAVIASPVLAQDTTARADSIRRMKAEQQPLPIDPRERHADSVDDAAAAHILAIARTRGNAVIWNAMRRSANPAVRARLIQSLAAHGIAAATIVRRLDSATDPGERAALIRALAQFPANQISPADRRLLTRLYATDPDAEVHSSIAWLRLVPPQRPRPPSLEEPALSAAKGRGGQGVRTQTAARQWEDIVQGYTMITLRPRGPFRMGAPPSEARSDSNELPHEVRIPRAFAIASTEVSVAQFQRFLTETNRRAAWLGAVHARWPNHPSPEIFVSDTTRAQFAVTWYEAAQYCNWLSAKAGIPKDQWVYPDSIGPGMALPADYLHRTGYRLPTEAEWEFAARGGNSAAHFFGEGVALLDQYAWYFVNSSLHGWPVGTKQPNQYGLFDIYGNAWEWINDRWIDYGDRGARPPSPEWRGGQGVRIDDEDTVLVVSDSTPRIRRGGSWSYDKETTRSAHRGAPGGYRPGDRKDSVGFRVARTIP